MKYKFYQYPRGKNNGGVIDKDICPAISCSSWENNCLLIEIFDEQEISQDDSQQPHPQRGGDIHLTPKLQEQ